MVFQLVVTGQPEARSKGKSCAAFGHCRQNIVVINSFNFSFFSSLFSDSLTFLPDRVVLGLGNFVLGPELPTLPFGSSAIWIL